MNHQALLYSLDPKLPLSKIQEDTEYDPIKYAKLQDRMAEHKIGAILASDTDFPNKLLPIRPKIHGLYYTGDISLLNRKTLGIVGPRLMSSYGDQVVASLFEAADSYAIVTISGMADGIDTRCHTLSLQQQIPTIAVLGGGLGRYLKRPEREMIEQIVAAGGLVISEYKLGEQPSKYTFPQRNRIIAGLADVLFLPEAGEKSGSLITVQCALTNNIPVYATPGSIFAPTSRGILSYIESGQVKPIIDFHRFLATHFAAKISSMLDSPLPILTDQEQKIVSYMTRNQTVAFQELADAIRLDTQEVMQILTMLEIKGAVTQEGPGRYMLTMHSQCQRER